MRRLEIGASVRPWIRWGRRPAVGLAATLSAALAFGCSPGAETSTTLSEADERSALAVERAYVEGWERNDSSWVMATLARDAVLLPDGMAPIRGDSAIRSYWWPADGSQTRVTSYETTVDEVGGSGSMAYLRGRGDLEFDWRARPDSAWRSFSSRSVWMTLLRRGRDGSWRMTHRIWHRVGSP